MGKMTLTIDDEIEQDFRRAIFEEKGLKKGDIKESIEEAIELWIEKKGG